MKKTYRLCAALALSILSLGCAGVNPQHYSDMSPRFRPEEFFIGRSEGSGVFFDRLGKLQLGFQVAITGLWDGQELILDELLAYDNGEIVTRKYRIKKLDEHHYEVTTSDIVGTGTIRSYGNALKWDYRLRQEIGESLWTLRFDDWMFLRPDGVVLNRAYASKFGIGIGEVFMTLRKSSTEGAIVDAAP